MNIKKSPLSYSIAFSLFSMMSANLAMAVTPPSVSEGLSSIKLKDAYIVNAPDTTAMKLVESKPGTPLAYGVVVDTPNLRMQAGRSANGQLSQLKDGRISWRSSIVSPGATSIDFEFSALTLPAGAQMYLYDSKNTLVRGPITSNDLTNNKSYFSPYVPGESAIVEIVAEPMAMRGVKLQIANISHGYRGIFNQTGTGNGTAKSGACNVDVACPLGNDWKDQIDSTGHYTFRKNGGSFVCTGSLIATTQADTAPNFLTAHHCVSTPEAVGSMVVYWNYQSKTCREPGSPASGSPLDRNISSHSQSGAELLATYSPSDFTLARLAKPVPKDAKPFFSGWDRRAAAPDSAIAIHHSKGHEKRISYDKDRLSITDGNTHLTVNDWDQGTTEPGASGSGLWNAKSKLLVGQLHRGSAACGNDLEDDYGRLYTSWTGGGTKATRLSDWLDPKGTGVETLAGYRDGSGNPPPPPPSNQAPKTSITSATGAGGGKPMAGKPITISAMAEDSDGKVAMVAFYVDDKMIGEDTTAPYSAVWNGAKEGKYVLKSVATDNAGAKGTSADFPIEVEGNTMPPPPPGGTTELMNRKPIRGISGKAGEELLYTFNVPEGVRGMWIMTYGGKGDVDLYARRDQAPTMNDYHCRSTRMGNFERCFAFRKIKPGKRYIMLKGKKDFENVTLLGMYFK